MYPEICENVGVEIEFNVFSISGSFNFKLPKGWRIERDGSCTRRLPQIGGIGLEIDEKIAHLFRTEQVGGEFVSPILPSDTKKIKEDVTQILELMQKHGEGIGDLTSVHVHVCMGTLPPCGVFKNLLQLCARLEAPMFKLSVAELGEHRGVTHNDYMYCRPIMGVGPQYIIDEYGNWRQCFDLEKILENAKTSEEIMRAWGRADFVPTKWIPPRYYWVNPVPLLRQGTIEFRVFNETLDPNNVVAWVALCMGLVKTAYYGSIDLDRPHFPLGEKTPLGESEPFRLKDMLEMVKFIDDDQLDQLQRLWLKSPWQPGVHEQVNHLSKSGRETPIQNVRKDLIPERVSREFIDSIWNQGYHEE